VRAASRSSSRIEEYDEKLELAGCFRDWDLGNLRDAVRRGGLDVAIQIRC
jgi:hypothetical protein